MNSNLKFVWTHILFFDLPLIEYLFLLSFIEWFRKNTKLRDKWFNKI